MVDLIQQLMHWVGAHPHLAGLAVATIACLESLAFVGLVVPGAVAMFGAGALIANGVLEFWPIAAWAVIGAVLGDAFSYWLGLHFKTRLWNLRPFRRYSGLRLQGEEFFQRHGLMSVFLGRFVGAVRPVVPVMAGVMGLSPARFLISNILSALAWAPAYLLPGMAFGASLALAGAVAWRLALLFCLLPLTVWATAWLVQRVYRFGAAHAERWTAAAIRSAGAHPRVAWLLGDLVVSERAPRRALAVWFALLIGGAWLFAGVLQDVIAQDPLVRADRAIYQMLQSVRDPPVDRLMVAWSGLGDAVVAIAVVAFVSIWLSWRRAWRDLGYWLAAAGFASAVVGLLKLALRVSRPVPMYSGADFFSFPSGHVTVSTAIYGFAAVLCAASLGPRWRPLPYVIATILIAGIGFARLYLGAHWLSDTAGGLGLGLAWVALLAIARQRHAHVDLSAAFSLALPALIGFVGILHVHARWDYDLQRYAVRAPVIEATPAAWWRGAWRELPAHRMDLGGEFEQPLNIQWAGDLNAVRERLMQHGWREPVPLTAHTALRWLAPETALAELPILPQLHNGRPESLLLVHDPIPPDDSGQIALRLWETPLRLEPDRTAVWAGTIGHQHIRHRLLVSFPAWQGEYDSALGTMKAALVGLPSKLVAGPAGTTAALEPVSSDHDILLVCQAAACKTDLAGQYTQDMF